MNCSLVDAYSAHYADESGCSRMKGLISYSGMFLIGATLPELHTDENRKAPSCLCMLRIFDGKPLLAHPRNQWDP